MSPPDNYIRLETHKCEGRINAAWMSGLIKWIDIDAFY